MLNVHIKAGQKVYYEDLASLMSMRARSAFNRMSYHVKLAGYANTKEQQSLEIINCDETDTLRVYHNDVEIAFYVNSDNGVSGLYESIDGSAKLVIDGVSSLRITRPSLNLINVELTLKQGHNDKPEHLLSRGYSTMMNLDCY